MREGDGYTIGHHEEFERDGKWVLVRRSLGLSSFGMNIVDIEPGDSIPEHDETNRDHEEVYIVIRGRPTMVIDTEEIQLEPQTFVRLAPHPQRHAVNNSDEPARLLIVSAPQSSGYEPMGWA